MDVLRKLHIYAGLQSLLALILFGLAGLCATYVHSSHFTPPEEDLVQIAVDGGTDISDRELVDTVFDELQIPLAPRPPDWSIKTGPGGEVRFDVRTPRSLTRVEIARSTNVAYVRQRSLSTAERVVILHEITWNRPLSKADWRCFLWSLYIEFSAWALLFFILSGVILWLKAPKRRRRLGIPFFLGGWLVLLAILVAMR